MSTVAKEPQLHSEGKNPIRESDIKEGMFWTRHSAGVIVGQDPTRLNFIVKNHEGLEWSINKSIVLREFQFATIESGEVIQCTQTELIELIKSNPRIAMQVTFHKKVEGKNVAEELLEGKGNLSDRQWIMKVNKVLKGESRTYIGFHTLNFDERGRLRFQVNKEGLRLLDLRTVTSVVVDGQRYQQRT